MLAPDMYPDVSKLMRMNLPWNATTVINIYTRQSYSTANDIKVCFKLNHDHLSTQNGLKYNYLFGKNSVEFFVTLLQDCSQTMHLNMCRKTESTKTNPIS